MGSTDELIRSEKTESNVLSCLLYEPDVWHNISDTITREHFWYAQHRIIFDTIIDLVEQGEEATLATVSAKLEQEGKLEDAGGEEKLNKVSSDIHFPDEAEPLAEVLDDYYRKRRYQIAGRTVADGLASGNMKADEAFETFAREVDEQSKNKTFKLGVELHEGLKEWREMQKRLLKGEDGLHVPTGIKPLDRVLHGGVVTSRFYLLAARPKHGKTKLAVAAANNLMKDHNYHVEFWYTDGSRRDILTEFIAASSKLRTDLLNSPRKVKPSEREEWLQSQQEALDNLVDYGSMNIYAVGQPKIEDICRTTRAVVAQQERPVILIVDYLQNVTAGFHGDDYANATAVSRAMAGLRTDMDIIVFGLSQFNRKAAQGGGMPKPHQLRASGQIEQDVNHLMIWHRHALDDDNATPADLRRGTLWHAMSKHSSPGQVEVDADLARNNFTSYNRPF